MPFALSTISQKFRSLGINAFHLCRDGIHRQNFKPRFLPASKNSKKRAAINRLCEGINSSDLRLSYFSEKANDSEADNLICMDVVNFVESGSLEQALLLLDLSRKAAETEADMIAFCGVKFMGESAKILNPDKIVVIPDEDAGCSLEDSCEPEEFKAFISQFTNSVVITYINSSAEVKALSDIIVTSSNAEAIILQIPENKNIVTSCPYFYSGTPKFIEFRSQNRPKYECFYSTKVP